MIIAGSLLAVLGLIGLIWCIIRGLRLRRADLAPEETRAGLQRIVALNMGALALSVFGLAFVVAGIMLS